MARIAVAIEIDLPDGIDPLTLTVNGVTFTDVLPGTGRIVRAEVHPDPDAIFADDDQ